MACFFCMYFEGNKNHDDSIAGTCNKFHVEIEERIAHEDCSFYATKDKSCISCIHKNVCFRYRLDYEVVRKGECTDYYEEPKRRITANGI